VNGNGQGQSRQMTFSGLSINFGTVVAPACLYSAERHRHVIEAPLHSDSEVERELERFQTAVTECSAELDRIAADAAKSIGPSEAEIFVTQKHIMGDTATRSSAMP